VLPPVMLRFTPLVACMLLLGALGAIHANDPKRPIKTVGVVFDGPAPADDTVLPLSRRDLTLATIKHELTALAAREFDIRFPQDKQLSGNWTLEGIRAAIERQMSDPKVDVILTLGALSTNEICRLPVVHKPVVAPWAIDINAQQLPDVGDASGKRNLNYLVSPGSILRDLRKLNEIHPISMVHVMIDSRLLAAIPEIPENVILGGRELGLDVVPVPVDTSADEALARLPADTEAVYVTPFLRMPDSEFDRVVAGLIERRIPSFSFMGQVDVERGLLAGIRSTTETPHLARRIALNIHRILLGEDAGTLPTVLDQPEKLLINMSTAEAIEFYPRWRVLIEAGLIDDRRRETSRTLSLSQAVQEAIDANLSLRSVEQRISAGAENIRDARSLLLPRLDAFTTGWVIDEDRAEASFGSQSERTLSVGVSATQLLYSDAALSNLEISKQLQQSLEQARHIEFLDVALQASTAFLQILRAETLERVEFENLQLTESNLNLARRREEIGFSGPADVYRWESQLARNRSASIAAQNQVDVARIALNQIRHRPLEERFSADEPNLARPDMVTGFGRLRPFVDDPNSFRLFREFSVGEGLSNAPEMVALDAGVQAQERIVRAARRAYGLPTVSFRADFERLVSRAGAGSDGTGFPGAPPGTTPIADRDNWSVSLQAGLPLFTGGARKAELQRTTKELSALRLERELLAERIELRIRVAMFGAGATFPAIELSREAAEAARKNLALVRDAYSQGLVSTIDLLDAQNAALVAEASAANAIYDFLIDLMEIQRSTNTFDFFRSEEGRDAWFQRLEEYFEWARPPQRTRSP